MEGGPQLDLHASLQRWRRQVIGQDSRQCAFGQLRGSNTCKVRHDRQKRSQAAAIRGILSKLGVPSMMPWLHQRNGSSKRSLHCGSNACLAFVSLRILQRDRNIRHHWMGGAFSLYGCLVAVPRSLGQHDIVFFQVFLWAVTTRFGLASFSFWLLGPLVQLHRHGFWLLFHDRSTAQASFCSVLAGG